MELLSDFFMGLRASKTSLYTFLKNVRALSSKIARKDSVKKNSVKKIKHRFEFVSNVLSCDIDYCPNYVFIDEAGFNINMKRSGGWAPGEKLQLSKHL